MFIDRVELLFQAGKGGDGLVAWRREKYIPKGGPTGGNGGKGGSIILEADINVHALDWFRNRKKVVAEDGRQGGTNCCQGRQGKDLLIKVPCGTLVKNVETGEIIKDLTENKARFILCKGGRGGRGNDSFKTPTRQAPNFATPGKPGESCKVELELKLIADVGLVGFPNAGKSTLISALADLKVKIAPYPFTTLRPNIGFILCENHHKIFIADIPGIIKDAHQNRGLGFEFLRHIDRTKLLVFVLDASGIDGRTPFDDYLVLRDELGKYDPQLLERPYYVVLNKIDAPESTELLKQFYENVKVDPSRTFEVSALINEGVDRLSQTIIEQMRPEKEVTETSDDDSEDCEDN